MLAEVGVERQVRGEWGPARSVTLEREHLLKLGRDSFKTEVTFHSVVEGVQAMEFIRGCGHVLFLLGFFCSESIWVN